MNGVDILSVEEVVVAWEYNMTAFWIVFGLIVAICMAGGLILAADSNDWSDFFGCTLIGLFIGVLLALMLGEVTKVPTEYAPQYKVTISDEVSMNDFMEKYEIIEQDGRIYTVMEKVQ